MWHEYRTHTRMAPAWLRNTATGRAFELWFASETRCASVQDLTSVRVLMWGGGTAFRCEIPSPDRRTLYFDKMWSRDWSCVAFAKHFRVAKPLPRLLCLWNGAYCWCFFYDGGSFLAIAEEKILYLRPDQEKDKTHFMDKDVGYPPPPYIALYT